MIQLITLLHDEISNLSKHFERNPHETSKDQHWRKTTKTFLWPVLRHGQQVVQDTDQTGEALQHHYTAKLKGTTLLSTLIGTTHSQSFFKCLVSHMLAQLHTVCCQRNKHKLPLPHTRQASSYRVTLTVSPLWIQNKALNPLKQCSRLSCWPPQVIQSRRLKEIVLSPRDYRLEDEQRRRDK